MDTAPHPAPPPPSPDRAYWTPARQRIFLAALMETGSVARAARAAGMSRSGAHRLRRRLAGTPFDRIWTAALQRHWAALADPFGARAGAMLAPDGRVADAGQARRRGAGVTPE